MYKFRVDPSINHEEFNEVELMEDWSIWSARNNTVMEASQFDSHTILKKINAYLHRFPLRPPY